MSHWSKLKEQSSGYWRLQFLLKIYQFFGKRFLQVLLYPIVFFIFIFAKNARKYSYEYLNRIYQIKISQNDYSFTKPHYISVFKHLISFANTLLDRIDSWSGKVDKQKLNIKTPKEIEEVFLEINQNQGPFFICSHLGNIEVLRALGNIHGEKKLVINSLVQFSHTSDFNNLLKKIHPDVSTNLISATNIGIDTVISIKEKLQNGEIVVAAGDRTAAQNENKVIAIDFLGKKANFPIGTFTLASLMESKIYFVFCLNQAENDGYDFYLYKSKINFISRAKRKENLEKIVNEYASYLEKLCLKYPNQWYNFFDFWK